MDKQWFVIQALSGHEFKVRENMMRRLEIEEMGDLIEEVLIPTEKVSEVKMGKKRELTRKFYPGYILGKLALYNEDHSINERTWHFIQQTPGIIGFIGGDKPAPLRRSEVDSILNQVEDKKEKPTPKINFTEGETIKINDGPFENFTGEVGEIDPVRGKLKVTVSIFGRTAPVELEYWQVEKIS
ncbi:transcription termination/antitermination protein NusG [Kiritimatiellaeota bacterium B1221]|nr:transcription termination/antitermination protein NusG [Kiritimatiellaeota bacterium B1221]